MYAIIETGSKQYSVKKGDIVEVELLGVKKDEAVEFKKVLFLKDGTKIDIGTPYLEKVSVHGISLGDIKGEKKIAYKYKRRKNYRKKIGHRQKYSKVQITEIKSKGK